MFEQNETFANMPQNESRASTELLNEFSGRNERQRGLWSFLTWSFFLAQIVAADEFLGGGAAHASQNLDDLHHGTDDAGGSSYSSSIGNPGSLADTPDESQTGAQNALQAGQQAAQDANVPGMDPVPVVNGLDGPGADAVQLQSAAVSSQAVSSDAISGEVIPGDGTGDGITDGGSNSPGSGVGPGDGITIGDIHIPSDILPDLGLVIDPVADLLDNTVTDVIQPLLGTTQIALNDVFNLVGDATDGLSSLLGQVGDTVGDGLDHILPGTGTLVADLTHTLGDTLHDTAEPLVSVVHDTTTTLISGLDDTVGTAGNLVQGLLGSAGALSFANDRIDVANAPNDMSTGAIHSDYRVALETTVDQVVTGTTDIVGGAAGATSSILDKIIGDHAHDTLDSSDDHHPNVLADTLDHFNHLFG